MSLDEVPYITNQEVARLLFQIASILEMTQANVYRVRAYRRAAFGTLMLPKPLCEYLEAGQRPPLPGVGERIHGRLTELVNTGHMGVYDTLLDEMGEPAASLLALHGVGPKTAIRLVNELGITSMRDLADAAQSGRIRRLRGFGERREASLGSQAESLLEHAA